MMLAFIMSSGCMKPAVRELTNDDRADDGAEGYEGTANSVFFADSPYPRDQPHLTHLLRWNGELVARGNDLFFEIDLEKRQAHALIDPAFGQLLCLAERSTDEAFALCESQGRRYLYSIRGDRLNRLDLPELVESSCGSLILVANVDDLVIATSSSCHRYREKAWQEIKGWTSQRIGKSASPYEDVLDWPPDHVVVADGVLYFGTDKGEFGGHLFAFNLATGTWTDLERLWGIAYRAITGIQRSPRGEIWVVNGLAHLTLLEGELRAYQNGKWALIARSDNDPNPHKVNWTGPSCDLRALAFAENGHLYVLSQSHGLFRREGSDWKHLTPSWPGFIYCSDLAVLPDGRVVIATCDAGLLLYTPGKVQIKRITLGQFRKWR